MNEKTTLNVSPFLCFVKTINYCNNRKRFTYLSEQDKKSQTSSYCSRHDLLESRRFHKLLLSSSDARPSGVLL